MTTATGRKGGNLRASKRKRSEDPGKDSDAGEIQAVAQSFPVRTDADKEFAKKCAGQIIECVEVIIIFSRWLALCVGFGLYLFSVGSP